MYLNIFNTPLLYSIPPSTTKNLYSIYVWQIFFAVMLNWPYNTMFCPFFGQKTGRLRICSKNWQNLGRGKIREISKISTPFIHQIHAAWIFYWLFEHFKKVFSQFTAKNNEKCGASSICQMQATLVHRTRRLRQMYLRQRERDIQIAMVLSLEHIDSRRIDIYNICMWPTFAGQMGS
jgi:hypothetical protein